MAYAVVTLPGMTNQISEETRVKVRVGTAWGVLTAIVGTTVWLTFLIVRIHFDNQIEHAKLMQGLAELNVKTSEFVTERQLEESSMFLVRNLHTNLEYIQEFRLRDGFRRAMNNAKSGTQ